jgi:hypothetical protein
MDLGDDPLKAELAALVGTLEQRARREDAALTCDDLVALLGPQSHALALLIFALLNLLPGPPGYSVVLGLVTIAFSLLQIVQRPLRLWPVVGNRRLPLRMMIRLLAMVQWLIDRVVRVSTPRLLPVVSPRMLPVIGLFGVLMGAIMLVPIPFTNTLPAVSVALVSIGVLNRDGVLALVGFAIGLLGLAVLAAAVWLLVFLVVAVEDALDGEP